MFLIQGLQHQNGKWILDRGGSTAVRDVPLFLLLYYTFLDFYCSNCLYCDVYHTYLLNISQWFNFLHSRIESRPAGIQNGQLWSTWVRNNEISISASRFWKTLAGRFHASIWAVRLRYFLFLFCKSDVWACKKGIEQKKVWEMASCVRGPGPVFPWYHDIKNPNSNPRLLLVQPATRGVLSNHNVENVQTPNWCESNNILTRVIEVI